MVKIKDFRRETKKWMAVFLFKRVRNVIKKAVSICVIILQDRKVKNNSTSHSQTFEHNGMKIYDQLKKPEKP